MRKMPYTPRLSCSEHPPGELLDERRNKHYLFAQTTLLCSAVVLVCLIIFVALRFL